MRKSIEPVWIEAFLGEGYLEELEERTRHLHPWLVETRVFGYW